MLIWLSLIRSIVYKELRLQFTSNNKTMFFLRGEDPHQQLCPQKKNSSPRQLPLIPSCNPKIVYCKQQWEESNGCKFLLSLDQIQSSTRHECIITFVLLELEKRKSDTKSNHQYDVSFNVDLCHGSLKYLTTRNNSRFSFSDTTRWDHSD